LAEAAEAVEYAPHHFALIFSDHTGLSVHQYLNELRLRQAAVRLDDGADNLTSLALDLGFSSQSHFTTAFRARFGCTPGIYRIRPTDSGAPTG
jgi:AraC-like DNA-binding protein